MQSRRKFIGDTAKLAAAITVVSGSSAFLESCTNTKKNSGKSSTPTSTPLTLITPLTQTPLPYAYNALENIIDAQTMEIHYSKHAAAYAKNMNDELATMRFAKMPSLEEMLQNISNFSTKMRNNAGGHYNHEMFWRCMRPKQENNAPGGSLLDSINKTFSSFSSFKTQFADASKNRFGSGWAWFYADNDKNLKIGSTANQDNPLMNVSDIKGFPLLALDVWEHAYYLKYQNKRADYIENWWQVVNWDYIQQRFETTR